MKLLVIITALIFSGCSDAMEDKKSVINSEDCDVFYKTIGPCVYKDITVNVDVKKISSDEKLLQHLNILKQGNKYTLNISKNTSILEGDKGYISFADINFDNVPDVAITTSFGLASLYMDYWVFDAVKNEYTDIGNYTKFEINNKNKTLSNVIKINAAKYKNTTYSWRGFKLTELK
ncbi:MAG: hypothetical protein QM484_02640 [Woeseiaceae bacterium]